MGDETFMNKKRLSGITKATVAALLAAGIITPSMAQAADGDYHLNGVNKGNVVKIIGEGGMQAFADVTANPATLYEADGKLYKLNDVATFLDQNQNITSLTQLYTELSKSGLESTPAPEETLTVQSVTATTTTVEKAANQQLKIQVNGNKEVTVKELTDAGYTVNFLFNKSGVDFNKTTGVVNGSNAGETFKYAVEVTPKEGAAITSAWVDVKVVDVAAITEVTKLQLSNKSAVINASETGVTVEAVEALNAGGKTVTEALPVVESITSSDATVLYAATDKTLTARKAGTVTLTVKFVGIEKTSTLAVEVKAAQEATKISEATVKTSLKAPTIQFKTLDADGKQLAAPVNAVTNMSVAVKAADGTTVGAGLSTKSADDFATGQAYGSGESGITVAGKYTVEVSAGSTKIGTYTLEVIDTAAELADEYKILTADNKNSAELDINAGTTNANKTTVTVSDYAKGVALGTTLDLTVKTKFEVTTATKDSKVVTVTPKDDGTIELLAGTATGSETITLYTVSGDYKEAVATFAVTVKNTTPQVTSLTLKNAKDPIELAQSKIADVETNIDDIKAAIVAKVQSNLETFTADHIAKVEVTTQGTVIVTIAAANGGKEFVLDYTEKDDVVPTLVANAIDSTSLSVSDDGKQITLVFSEALDAAKFITGANNFSVASGGTLTSAELASDGKTVILKGTDFVIGTTTVSYTAGTLTDVAGNALATFGPETTVATPAQQVAKDLATAKAAIEALSNSEVQSEVTDTTASAVTTKVETAVNELASVTGKGFTVTVNENTSAFVAPQNGVSTGTYKFTVTLSKDAQSVTTTEVTITIPQS